MNNSSIHKDKGSLHSGKGSLHIGTSGWSYKHWKGLFYPHRLPATEYLSYYARLFRTAEINTSFYRLPKPDTLLRWVRAVPDNFLFCPKISRYITHVKKLNDPETTLPRFFRLFEPFKKHLGPILLQLPANVAYHEEKARPFFETLRGYKGYQYALEVRHDSWFQPSAIALLKRYRISLVIAYSGGRWPSAEIVTARHIYLRFHGPDGSYGTDYIDKALKGYAKKCLAWQAAGHTIWAFFNNDGHGYALRDARVLVEATA
jgi:uncharacterized protein YecE (DUF72 family)